MILPNPLTTEQLAALGRITLESAYLERLVDTLIMEIAKLSDEQFRALLPGAMLAAKLEILNNLAILKLKSKSKKEKIGSIISKLKHLNSQRTIAIHGQWQSLEKISFADFAKGDSIRIGNAEATHVRGNRQPSKLHVSKLQDIADGISEYCNQLADFCLLLWIRPAAVRRLRKELSKARS